jgi:hypothetical protein
VQCPCEHSHDNLRWWQGYHQQRENAAGASGVAYVVGYTGLHGVQYACSPGRYTASLLVTSHAAAATGKLLPRGSCCHVGGLLW